MKLIEQLKAQLESIGASLDDDGYVLNCDAPSGYVWRSNDCVTLPVQYATNEQTWLAKAIRDAKPDFALGLEKVTDAKRIANIRHIMDDDNWGAPLDAPETIEWPK